MNAKELLKEEKFGYDYFKKLTSTGISPDEDNISEFAEDYCSKKTKELKVINKELLESLQGLLENHVQLVSCGDCGHWDVETEEEVIKARKAIEKALK